MNGSIENLISSRAFSILVLGWGSFVLGSVAVEAISFIIWRFFSSTRFLLWDVVSWMLPLSRIVLAQMEISVVPNVLWRASLVGLSPALASDQTSSIASKSEI